MADEPKKTKIACSSCGQRLDVTGVEPFSKVACPVCSTKLLVPMIIGNFQLLSPIGSGGMGTVYKAFDSTLHRFVAIKLMKKELAADPQFVEDFTREARAAAALNHANIAQILSFGKVGSQYYLVMELLEGGSLDNKIEAQKRVPELEVLEIGAQVASALRAAQQRGLIHRDIKPGNILFNLEGQARVVDFGLAQFAEEKENKKEEEGIWGTPYYIAPEKLNGEKEDFRSDMYSLGGTLFHALAGRAPFEADSATEVVLKRLKAPALSLKTFAPDICDETAQIIGRLLRQNRIDRYESYDELIAELQAAKVAAVAHAKRRLQPQIAPRGVVVVKPSGPRPRAKELVAPLVFFIACVAAGFGIWTIRFSIFGHPEGEVTTSVAPISTTTTAPKQAEDWLGKWVEADNCLARGNYTKALATYRETGQILRSNPEKNPLISCQIAATLYLMGRTDEAKAAVQKGSDAALPEKVSAANYGSVMAQLVSGTIKADKAQSLLEKQLPPAWTLAQFYLGAQALAEGRYKESAQWLDGYVKAQVTAEPRWVGVFQSHARDLLTELENLNSAGSDITKLRLGGDSDQAIVRFKELVEKVKNPLMQARIKSIEQEIKQSGTTEDSGMGAQQPKGPDPQLVKQREQFLADMPVLEKAAAAVPAFVVETTFDAAAKVYADAAAQITTPALKKIAQDRATIYERLDAMKKGAIEGINKTPYAGAGLTTRRGGMLIGKPSQADASNVTFVDARGQMMGAWRDFAPVTVLTLLTYYSELANAQNPAARGANMVAMAWLSHEYKQDQYATAYSGRAVALSPQSKTEWEALSAPLPAPPELPNTGQQAGAAAKGGDTSLVMDVELPTKKKTEEKKPATK